MAISSGTFPLVAYENVTGSVSKALLKLKYITSLASFVSTRLVTLSKNPLQTDLTRFILDKLMLAVSNTCYFIIYVPINWLFDKIILVTFWLLKAGWLFYNLYFVIGNISQNNDPFYCSQSILECSSQQFIM